MELSAKQLTLKRFPTVVPDFALTNVHIKLLKHAKKRIKGVLEDYVCSAITHGASNPDESGVKCCRKEASYAAYDLKRFIRRAIKERVYFDSWQRLEAGINRTLSEVRKDRVAWINFLLKESARARDNE